MTRIIPPSPARWAARTAAAACLALALVGPGGRVDARTRVTITGATGGQIGVSVVRDRELLYADAAALAPYFQSRKFVNRQDRKLEMYPENVRVKLTAENAFVEIGDHLYQMPVECRYLDDRVFVPIEPLLALLNRHLSREYVFELNAAVPIVAIGDLRPGRGLPLPGGGPKLGTGAWAESLSEEAWTAETPAPSSSTLTGLVIEEKANGTLVRVRSTGPLREPRHWLNEQGGWQWLYVQIPGSVLDPAQFNAVAGRGLVVEVRAEQLGAVAQLGLRLRRRPERISVTHDAATRELYISLSNNVDAAAMAKIDVAAVLRRERKTWTIDTIVLDAGHGGKDPGTSRGSLREKTIALDVTRRLGELLRDRTDYQIVFTRDRDVFVPLYRRGQIANERKGKLFVSIHVNASSRSRRASGIETYFLRPGGRDREAIAVAERENRVAFQYEEDVSRYDLSENNKMRFEILHSGIVAESEELAALVQKHLVERTGAANRGVKQGWLMVLWRASMPHVLCELGFLSNSAEARKLGTATYRQKLAEGIYHGIEEYAARRRSQLATSSVR